MKKPAVLTIVLIMTIILVIFGWQFFGSRDWAEAPVDEATAVPTEDPFDVTMELYGPWLAGLQATSTPSFNKAEVLTAAPLTAELREILQQQTAVQSALDPVLCQVELPQRIGLKSVFVTDTESQVIVVARGKKVPEQALVTLAAVSGEWVISDIACSRGEFAPELEYTFDREGNLLQQSLLPPLDNEQWHLIYTKDGVAGNAIPLLFAADSICVLPDGIEQVCVPDQLTEAAAVQVQGAMQEAGVLVERMQLQ